MLTWLILKTIIQNQPGEPLLFRVYHLSISHRLFQGADIERFWYFGSKNPTMKIHSLE